MTPDDPSPSLSPSDLLDQYERAAQLAVDFDNPDIKLVDAAKKQVKTIRDMIIRLIHSDPTK